MLAVFLDFDGVINRGAGRWQRPLVEQLNRITQRTGAKIIVHSSWRWGRSLDELRKVLTAYHLGVPVTGEVYDVCPSALHYKTSGGIYISDGNFAAFKGDIETNDERAIAIQRWLNEHPGEVERFVILDDSPNLGHFVGTPEFIQTVQYIGLTPEQADKAIQHLKGVT